MGKPLTFKTEACSLDLQLRNRAKSLPQFQGLGNIATLGQSIMGEVLERGRRFLRIPPRHEPKPEDSSAIGAFGSL